MLNNICMESQCETYVNHNWKKSLIDNDSNNDNDNDNIDFISQYCLPIELQHPFYPDTQKLGFSLDVGRRLNDGWYTTMFLSRDKHKFLGKFNRNVYLCKQYMVKHNKNKITHVTKYEGDAIGSWLNSQKKRFKG